jgi:hypothetical protein
MRLLSKGPFVKENRVVKGEKIESKNGSDAGFFRFI